MGLLHYKIDDADIVKSVTDEEFRAYIGPNKKFMQVRENIGHGKYISFNFMAFLLPIIWLIYRKQWLLAFVVAGLLKLVSNIGDKLFSADAPISYLFFFMFSLIPGFFMNAYYVLLSCQNIIILKNKVGNHDELMTLLQKKGGTSLLALSVIFILLLVVIVASLTIGQPTPR